MGVMPPGTGCGSAATAMDIGPRVSAGDAPSPFSGLGLSPGITDSGIPDIPEDFIANLNGAGAGPGAGGGMAPMTASMFKTNAANSELLGLFDDELAGISAR